MEALDTKLYTNEKGKRALNTLIIFNRERINLLREKADIQIIRDRRRGAKRYDIRLNTGETIGKIEEIKGEYLVEFFNSYRNKIHFTKETNENIEKIRKTVKEIRDKKIREFIDEVPKYHVTPRKRIRGRSLKMFQPIKDGTGEYWEMTNQQINGRTIIGYRRVNVISGAVSGKWKYEFIQPIYPQITYQPQRAA